MTDSIIRPDQDQPSELDRAVRAAAAAQPAPRLDISRVRSRARAHRRRRIAIPIATVVILFAAFITALSVIRPTGTPGGVPQQTPVPAAAVPEELQFYLSEMPAQLLSTSGGEAVYVAEGIGGFGGVAAGFDAEGTSGRLLPVPSIPGLEGALGTYSFGGGWLASIGASKPPDKAIQHLIVMDGSGRVLVARDIPLREGYSVPYLLGGSHTTAIYQVFGERTTLVAFDLATGAERDLWKATAIGPSTVHADATAKQVAVWPADPGSNCSVDVLDAMTGEVVQQVRPAMADCARVDYKLAPDGVLLAGLVTHATSDRMIQRVVILDIASGTIRKDVEVASWPIHRLAAPTDPQLVAGIDWIDPTSLVYVRGARPLAGREGHPPTVSAIRV